MNIVVDVRPLLGGRLSGVEVYTLKLLEHLFKIDTNNRYVLFANSAKNDLPDLSRFLSARVRLIKTTFPNKILNILLVLTGHPLLDRMIRRRIPDFKTDIFFQPDLRPLALSRGIRTVCTVHDLSYRRFPHFFSLKTRLWHRFLNAGKRLQHFDRIISVSDFTKGELVSTYGIDPDSITVIHEGVEEDFCTKVRPAHMKSVIKKYGLPERYFLFLATHEPRKNLARIIEAFRLFKKSSSADYKLVIVGMRNDAIFAKMNLSTDSDVIFTGFVPEADKPCLFNGAAAFLYPSIYEGFGLPLLEAMRCGTPVITSDTSSMPEICGDAAILVDPHSVQGISEAMTASLDPAIREKLKKAMSRRIDLFSWKKCARRTLALFDSISNG
jgi:glycosyltransferase involved in cell wall biosynthesis